MILLKNRVSVFSVCTVRRSGGEIFQSVDAAGPLGSSAAHQDHRQKNICILTGNNNNNRLIGGKRPSERAQSPAVSVSWQLHHCNYFRDPTLRVDELMILTE